MTGLRRPSSISELFLTLDKLRFDMAIMCANEIGRAYVKQTGRLLTRAECHVKSMLRARFRVAAASEWCKVLEGLRARQEKSAMSLYELAYQSCDLKEYASLLR